MLLLLLRGWKKKTIRISDPIERSDALLRGANASILTGWKAAAQASVIRTNQQLEAVGVGTDPSFGQVWGKLSDLAETSAARGAHGIVNRMLAEELGQGGKLGLNLEGVAASEAAEAYNRARDEVVDRLPQNVRDELWVRRDTAGDRRVCGRCERLDGRIAPLTVGVSPRVPLHAKCRCTDTVISHDEAMAYAEATAYPERESARPAAPAHQTPQRQTPAATEKPRASSAPVRSVAPKSTPTITTKAPSKPIRVTSTRASGKPSPEVVAKREAVAKAKAELAEAKRIASEQRRSAASEARIAKETERLAKLEADSAKAKAVADAEKARAAAEAKAVREAEAAAKRAAAEQAKAARESKAAEKLQKPKPIKKSKQEKKPAPKQQPKPVAPVAIKPTQSGDAASAILQDIDAQKAEIEQGLARIRARIADGTPDKRDVIGAAERQLAELAERRAVVERAMELRSRMTETASVEEAIQARVLTTQQREYIKDFTYESSTAIRRAQSVDFPWLHGLEPDLWDGIAQKGRVIEQAIEQNVKFKGELWRGISVTGTDSQRILSSSELDWLGCTTSTSTDLAEAKTFAIPSASMTDAVAADGPVVLLSPGDEEIVAIVFHIPNGRGLAIQDIGIAAEKEVLMSGSSRFRVVGKKFEGGRWYLELDQIE